MYPILNMFPNDVIEVRLITDTFNYTIAFKYLYCIDNEKYIFEEKIKDKTITFEIDNSTSGQSVIDLTPFVDYVNGL